MFVSLSKVLLDHPEGRGKFMSIRRAWIVNCAPLCVRVHACMCVSVQLSSAKVDSLLEDKYFPLCSYPSVCLCVETPRGAPAVVTLRAELWALWEQGEGENATFSYIYTLSPSLQGSLGFTSCSSGALRWAFWAEHMWQLRIWQFYLGVLLVASC